MSQKINPSKLLPQSKSTALATTQKPSIKIKEKRANIASFIKPIDLRSSTYSKNTVKEDKVNDKQSVIDKLLKIDKFLKSDFLVSQKKAESKRKEKEKKDFDEAERKLELPKIKGFSLPKLPSLPTMGILEKIKRFIFFTALGWLFPKILEFLPKLEGFVKLIGGVYEFAEGLFGKLFDGFMSLVKFGGDLKEKTLGFITQITGGDGKDYQQRFDKLENLFNTFVNASIIAGLVGLDLGLAGLDEYNKWKKKNAKPKPEGPAKPKGAAGEKPPKSGSKPPTPKPSTGGKPSTPKPKLSWWEKLTSPIKSKIGKLAKPFSRFASVAVPGLGAAMGYLDMKARKESGDNLGAFLAGLSAGLDTFTLAVGTAALASAATGIGIPGAAVLGSAAAAAGTISMTIDAVLFIRDILKLAGVNEKLLGYYRGGKIVRKYQGGGTTSKPKSSKPVTPPRRTLKVKPKKPPKIAPPKTKPGKDVGGEKKVKDFYSKNAEGESLVDKFQKPAGGWLRNLFGGGLGVAASKEQKSLAPYNALTSTAEILKEIPLVGGIMGAAVDVALGQKPDRKVYKSLSSGIGYFVQAFTNQQVNLSISSLVGDIRGFAAGGYVPPSRELKPSYDISNIGDTIAKVLEPTIEQKVNDAVKNIANNIRVAATGRDEMLQENQRRAQEGGPGPGDGGGKRSQEEADLAGGAIAAPKELIKEIGANSEQWDIFRNSIALIESKGNYSVFGGSGKHYDGRYQMGEEAKIDAAKILGISFPGHSRNPNDHSRVSFRSNKELQERMFAAYTTANHRYLMRNDKYKNASIERKLEILGYAHNQGMGNAEKWLNTGEVGVDGFGTKGTKYTDLIAKNFKAKRQGKKLTVADGALEISDAQVEPGIFKPISGQSGTVKYGGQERTALSVSYSPFKSDQGRPRISSGKGFRRSTGTPHKGIDIEADEGTPMYAYLPGTIIFSGDAGNYGYRVEWKDSKGNIHSYSHLQKDPGFKPGQKIQQGSFLGFVGKTGRSTGPHLHWEIQNSSGEYQDPTVWTKQNPLPKPKDEKQSSTKREYDVIIPLDHHKGMLPDKSLWPNASQGASGRERAAQDPTAQIIKARLERKGLKVKIMRPEDYRTEDDYNKDLVRFSKAGSVVSSIHYDAPANIKNGGIGFLARLGNSPDKNDREYAEKLAIVLQRMAKEAGGAGQRYGGIDTQSNITMRMSGPATAALIELGALVEQEKKYGKEFWRNPEFIKHLNDIADATASSVQTRSPDQKPVRKIGEQATLKKKPVVWDGKSWVETRSPQGVKAIREGQKERKKENEAKLRAQRPWWDKFGWFGGATAEKQRRSRKPPQKMEGGGPIPISSMKRDTSQSIKGFASYETYGSSTSSHIAVLPVHIKQTVPVASQSSPVLFPVPIPVGEGLNSIDEMYRTSRGY